MAAGFEKFEESSEGSLPIHFQKAFGQEWKSAMWYKHYSIWLLADSKVKAHFVTVGKIPGGKWSEFVKEVPDVESDEKAVLPPAKRVKGEGSVE
jgi:hypothetical protein